MIIEETNRCKGIVSNLLNFARQGRLKLEKENIVQMVLDVIKTAKLNPLFKEIKYSFKSELINENIIIDSDQIKQVILNLIQNASEALEDSKSKKVDVSISIQNNNLKIEIADTGCGIEENNIKKLFIPFFTTKKIGKGTGLGLAISYGIIKMHNGNLMVKSELGKGSTFTIILPIPQENNFELPKEKEAWN
jgi:two-component system NtrC family sensor kinase